MMHVSTKSQEVAKPPGNPAVIHPWLLFQTPPFLLFTSMLDTLFTGSAFIAMFSLKPSMDSSRW